jgi:hypothetical protein
MRPVGLADRKAAAYLCSGLVQVRFVLSTGQNPPAACYKVGVISRITQFALWNLLAVLLMWPLIPASALDASPIMMESTLTVQDQSRCIPLAQEPHASPDCTMYPDCPTEMSKSNCSVSGPTCSIGGVSILMHRVDEQWFRPGTAQFFLDPLRLLVEYRPVSIFHPPRSS